jgi:hypothetical protein
MICMEWERCPQTLGCNHAKPHEDNRNCHRACGALYKAVCMEASDEVLVYFKLMEGKDARI